MPEFLHWLTRSVSCLTPYPFRWAMLLFALAPATAFGAMPKDGLAVALSPDGERLVVAGENRTLYLLDADTFDVTERYYLGHAPVRLVVTNSDRVWLLDEEEELFMFDLETAKLESVAKEVLAFTAAPMAGKLLFAIQEADKTILKLLQLDDAKVLRTWELEEPVRVETVALSADGTQAGYFSKTLEETSEQNSAKEDLPPGLSDAERKAWDQQRDGRAAEATVWETQSGKKLWERRTYFVATGSTCALIHEGRMCVAGFGNFNASIPEEGPVQTYAASDHLNYAMAFSEDGQWLYSGGRGEGAFTPLREPEQSVVFALNDLAESDETFTGFAGRGDGKIYATTSAWRLFEFDQDAKIIRWTPVY